jgi:multidrug efflux pump subunit AcrA (membrane-fusion protein)
MWFWGLVIFLLLTMFLPWTQNIKSKGVVTTLMQEQRMQKINSPIPGKIVRWWVKEGDFVKKGDTILQLAEIKEEYLDPQLVDRTRQQLDAKRSTINYYQGKVTTTASQIAALENARDIKISLLQNKLRQLGYKLDAERAELAAIDNELLLAKDQFERQQKMFDDGLVSQTQLQQRNQAYQNALSKKIGIENKLSQTKQDMGNITLEQNSTLQDYAEKISKVESDRFQSLSQITTTEADVAKLQNQVTNYVIRNGMYIMLAPQDGQIVQAGKSGIGEILKDGETIASIVPERLNYAVEMFIRPVDLPLVSVGQKVQFMFDGFPAIVFSGWPQNSYGTFSGKIVAIENSISQNGSFRVLVAEDSTVKKWPAQLKIGSGAQGITLLKDVPIWYELWRNINGFPPEYYQLNESKKINESKK